MRKPYFPPVEIQAIYTGSDIFSSTYQIETLVRSKMGMKASQKDRLLVLTDPEYGFTMEYVIVARHEFNTYYHGRDYRRALEIIQRVTQMRVSRIIREINRQ